MKVAFFLIPKSELVCLNTKTTMRQALERMEHHSYTAVPLIDDKGCYAGTITEGDLLWKMKNSPGLNLAGMEKILVKDIACHAKIKAVRIDARIVDLLTLASEQNFVPVVDDQEVFIGIVRRREIIEYCAELISEKEVNGVRS
ncbi:MAG: CBS domain-containing protein [Firmicutes bacterium]|nr:CBS domain-containing protein [Bacillota bacterium]